MSQSMWEPEVAAEAQPEPQREQPVAEAGALALSADDFSALEERILRAVETVKRERQARAAAEERATQAEAQLSEMAQRLERMKAEGNALKTERDEVRQRVERLLEQLDGLEV
jgi:predicted nuclease with TOPRIM domain